jgi:hypothetical protein
MFGCLRRLGCLVLLAVLVCAAYFTRSRWLPLVTSSNRRAAAALDWKPLSAEGADRARRTVRDLDRAGGQVFANVSAADFASYVLDSASLGFTRGRHPAEAAIQGDKFLLRTKLRVADLGVENVPLLKGIADKTATVIIGGTLSVERTGLGEWQVKSITVDAIDVPGVALTRVTRALANQPGRPGTRDDAFGFPVPAQIADLRIHNGVITLYKSAK